MNPLENEIRDALKHREPAAGFAEHVISQAGRGVTPSATLKPMRSPLGRLTIPAAVILVAIAAVGITGIVMTRCASACTDGISGIFGGVIQSSLPEVPSVGGAHSLGPERAEFVLDEYGDYQCPSCGYYFPVVEDIIQRFPTQLRFVYHQFPLTQIHANAMGAAIAAEAAGEQNHFWEMHRMLFEHQKEWSQVQGNSAELFTGYAAQIGLDANRFRESLASSDLKQRVLDDLQRGRDAKIEGTPTFFLNGQVIPPTTPQKFRELLEQRLTHQ